MDCPRRTRLLQEDIQLEIFVWFLDVYICKCLLFCHFKFCHDRKNHFRATQQRHLSHINAKERSDAIERLVSKGFSVQYNLEPFHSEQWLKTFSKTISVVWESKMNSNDKAIWHPSVKRCHCFIKEPSYL